jgi:hypothetical protein
LPIVSVWYSSLVVEYDGIYHSCNGRFNLLDQDPGTQCRSPFIHSACELPHPHLFLHLLYCTSKSCIHHTLLFRMKIQKTHISFPATRKRQKNMSTLENHQSLAGTCLVYLLSRTQESCKRPTTHAMADGSPRRYERSSSILGHCIPSRSMLLRRKTWLRIGRPRRTSRILQTTLYPYHLRRPHHGIHFLRGIRVRVKLQTSQTHEKQELAELIAIFGVVDLSSCYSIVFAMYRVHCSHLFDDLVGVV